MSINSQNEEVSRLIRMILFGGIQKAVKNNKPFHMTVELNKNCKAQCKYCYSSAADFVDSIIDTDVVYRIIDDAQEIGIRIIYWWGGDPLLHPHWFDIFRYCSKKRIVSNVMLTGFISPADAEKLTSIKSSMAVTFQMDTIDQGIYNIISKKPETLKERMAGYNNLVNAGFPREQIYGKMIISKAIIPSYKETLDWFANDVGVSFVSCGTYKDQRYVKMKRQYEVSLSDKRRVMEYRDQCFGNFLEKMGTCDLGMAWCRSHFIVYANGDVSPCYYLYDFIVGNIYQDSIINILQKHSDILLFNYEINGFCSQCKKYNSICIGCRADAYQYAGDVCASSPKCFMNSNAREYYCSD
jgi:pyrroloquinoline quinone biosynthesis protein E